jgi:hypothetical protein
MPKSFAAARTISEMLARRPARHTIDEKQFQNPLTLEEGRVRVH